MNLLGEHDFEPIAGLPGPLPDGECILWQGKPDWVDLAINALHVRKLVIYFTGLLVLRIVLLLREGMPVSDILLTSAVLAAFAALALGLLTLMAWLMARACVYTVTNRRLVIRSGVALPMTVNLPFARIVSADLRLRSNGYGDISLALSPESQASWIVLWPNVRPWHIGKVQPMMRSLPGAERVAESLGHALRSFAQEDAGPAGRSRVVTAAQSRRSEPGIAGLHAAH